VNIAGWGFATRITKVTWPLTMALCPDFYIENSCFAAIFKKLLWEAKLIY
jgi:hypothetical protein